MWSSLPNVEKISNGKWDVPHFTAKAKLNDKILQAAFPFATFVEPPFYYQNLTGQMKYQTAADGSKSWSLPIPADAPIQMGDVSQFGLLVAGVFKNPKATNGETLSFVGDSKSFNDICKLFEEVRGEKVAFNKVDGAQFSHWFPGAAEIAQMLGYFAEFTYMGPNAEGRIKRGNEVALAKFSTLKEWLAQEKK